MVEEEILEGDPKGEGNMNEMSFNEGLQRIMNLDLILAFWEIWCIKCGD